MGFDGILVLELSQITEKLKNRKNFVTCDVFVTLFFKILSIKAHAKIYDTIVCRGVSKRKNRAVEFA